MRSFLPPHPGAAPEPGVGWGLRRTVRLAFPEPSALGRDAVHAAQLDTYLSDMLRPYGLGLDAGAPTRGGRSYGEMAEALIASILPAGESVDLLVLAYTIPDITPGRATTTYLSHICPGRPMAFAISDQGTAAAFTGLRLIREYARTTELRRALLLVVEQSALPYDPGVPVTVPAGDTGVALLFGHSTEEVSPLRTPLPLASAAVQAGCSASALADLVGTLTGDRAGTRTIVGAGLGGRGGMPAGLEEIRFASPGQPGTGVWWELAGLFAEGGVPERSLLLADFEPGSRSLCLAEFAPARPDPGDPARIPALVDGSLA
jgi:hypothetical protein